MAEEFDSDHDYEITIRLPADTYIDMATDCYCCCGHASNEAVSRMASLFLHHAWQDIRGSGRHPYWLSSVFEEIEDV